MSTADERVQRATQDYLNVSRHADMYASESEYWRDEERKWDALMHALEEARYPASATR